MSSAGWTRHTPWRQGHVLPREAATKLGLADADQQDVCAIVISHDCDLALDNLEIEPDVEVMLGRVREKFDGNFTWGPFDFSARSDGSRPPAERALARGSLCALTQVLVRQ